MPPSENSITVIIIIVIIIIIIMGFVGSTTLDTTGKQKALESKI
jgi:flagellar basal body-associated protein FliL